MKRFASIDLGSNTVRLLIGEESPEGDLSILHEERRIIRLGEGLHTEARLQPHRIQRALETLSEFKTICGKFGDVYLYAAATSAVREAANREEFVEQVKRETGIDLNVISWQEEAECTLRGVQWKLQLHDKRYVVFDIGGGSTEFIRAEGAEVMDTFGTRLGVMRLTERFITRHPVDPEELAGLTGFLSAELAAVQIHFKQARPEILIGTAGTVTTLAAIAGNVVPYDPSRIHGSTLGRDEVEAILQTMCAMTLEERLNLPALEQGREDLIIAGTAVTLAAMEAFEVEDLTVSEYGLREGLLLEAQRLGSA